MAIQVKAIRKGYFGQIREEGDVFEIENKKQFSKRWMEEVKAAPAAEEQRGDGAGSGQA